MLGLTQTARLYKRLGRQNGAETFSETGTEFACRVEERSQRNAKNGTFRRNDEVRRGNERRIFAQETLAVETGDCIEADGKRYIVKSVRRLRRIVGAHHVEIVCGGEG